MEQQTLHHKNQLFIPTYNFQCFIQYLFKKDVSLLSQESLISLRFHGRGLCQKLWGNLSPVHQWVTHLFVFSNSFNKFEKDLWNMILLYKCVLFIPEFLNWTVCLFSLLLKTEMNLNIRQLVALILVECSPNSPDFLVNIPSRSIIKHLYWVQGTRYW